MRRTDWRDYKIIFYVIVFFITAFVGFKGWAEEQRLNDRPVPIAGGLICDNLDDVVKTLDTTTHAETCGNLDRPVPAFVYALGTYETNGYKFLLARYEFVAPVQFDPVQYGFWGRPIKIGEPDQQL